MDPRQLEYFLAVAESGSISAAARQAGVAQPTVSEAMRRLESELGVVLLRRRARGVDLTDAGRDLVGPAAQVVRAHADLHGALRPALELERGRLTLVCPRTLAQDPVARMVGDFRRRYPGVTVTLLRPHDAERSADVVGSGRAEVGVGVAPGDVPDLLTERLGRQRVVALVRPGTVTDDEPRLSDLAELGIITTPRGGVTRELLARHLSQKVVDEAVAVETSSTGAMVPLVRAGLGVAFVPEVVGRDAVGVGLDMRRTRPALVRDVWLIHGRTPSPAATAFVALARRMRDDGEIGEPA